ncbi:MULTISPECIES: hypothetical protein [Arthrobacter]|uniref:PH domain-containing protein n=2 Tax=Arthrobacter TaxID=1663 RepID=A0ABU9KN99_9MICC|nr:hypothetical protein [Arthrobacter sp. YJM1]MDP5228434.1 hypothetical protein [Arthrobacter sp. YJM1]
MSFGGTAQQLNTDEPAHWVQDGEDFVLTVRAAERRDALRPVVWLTAVAAGILAAGLSASAGSGTQVALGLATLVFATVAFVQYYLRLLGAARLVTLRFGPQELTITDGDRPPVVRPLSAVTRVLIAHDGAPARIRTELAREQFSWTIGDLYRHNTIAPFVDAVPSALRGRLTGLGLVGGTVTQRRVRVSEYRSRRH